MRSGLVWAAVMVVLAAGCRGGGLAVSAASKPATTTGVTCTPAQLRVSAGPDVSPATGMNPEAVRITNTGPRRLLDGYPAVRFTDPASAAIPFRLSQSGDQMVTAHPARRVVVPHGGAAWVVLDTYRCDLGNRVRVGEIELRLAGEGRIGAIALDIAGWSYCGPGDPGSTVHVSPFEPRLPAALRQG
ncbi:MAG TPA: DUF4232 domain-containing protein [Gaiellales bacterium]|nr:DUF4232 domain-containing protein [Gaiellales bacterium]